MSQVRVVRRRRTSGTPSPRPRNAWTASSSWCGRRPRCSWSHRLRLGCQRVLLHDLARQRMSVRLQCSSASDAPRSSWLDVAARIGSDTARRCTSLSRRSSSRRCAYDAERCGSASPVAARGDELEADLVPRSPWAQVVSSSQHSDLVPTRGGHARSAFLTGSRLACGAWSTRASHERRSSRGQGHVHLARVSTSPTGPNAPRRAAARRRRSRGAGVLGEATPRIASRIGPNAARRRHRITVAVATSTLPHRTPTATEAARVRSRWRPSAAPTTRQRRADERRARCIPTVSRARQHRRRVSVDLLSNPCATTRRPENRVFSLVSAPGRTRTCGQVLRRHLLYPLSYGRWRLVHCGRCGVHDPSDTVRSDRASQAVHHLGARPGAKQGARQRELGPAHAAADDRVRQVDDGGVDQDRPPGG